MPTLLIQDSQTEWISLAAAKLHVKLDADLTADDATVTSLITTVRHLAESQTRRAIMDSTYELVQDRFTAALPLTWPRVLQVIWVRYIDPDGAQHTLDPADYVVDDVSEPGWVVPASGRAWPAIGERINAVRVRYRAGYGDAAKVPGDLRSWMLLHLDHYYRHRAASVAGGVQPLPHIDRLLDGTRIWGF